MCNTAELQVAGENKKMTTDADVKKIGVLRDHAIEPASVN